MEVYKCVKCGNVVENISQNEKIIKCCESEMIKLKANETDAATEKHVPIYEKIGDEIIVKVGKISHPMEEEHYIEWIAEEKDNMKIIVNLKPGEKPEAKFPYIKGATIYAYCNKHGLWKNII